MPVWAGQAADLQTAYEERLSEEDQEKGEWTRKQASLDAAT